MENRYQKQKDENNLFTDNKNLNLCSVDLTNNNNVNSPLDSSTYKNLSIKDKLRNSLKIRKSAENLNQNNNTITRNNLSSLPYNNNEDKINNYNCDYLSGEEDLKIINSNKIIFQKSIL